MSVDGRIIYGRNGKEQRIGRYFVDGFNPQTKTVYEYNGCVFHGHPQCTDEDDKVPFGNITMREAYEQFELVWNILPVENSTLKLNGRVNGGKRVKMQISVSF